MSGGTLLLIRVLLVVAVWIALGWALVRWGSWRAFVAGQAIIVSALWTSIWLYSHRATPQRPACALPVQVGELGSICGYQNPEDLDVVPSRNILIASEERSGGRLMGLELDHLETGPFALWPRDDDTGSGKGDAGHVGDPNCAGPPDASTFYPHGISVADLSKTTGAARIAVVAHTGRETIQFFDMNADGPARLTWRGCIFYPELTTGNDVALFTDGSLVATNYTPVGGAEGAGYRLRGGFGFDTGDVLAWSQEGGWTHVPNTNGAMPNGIVGARDESAFYFADAGGWRVAIVPHREGNVERARVRVGGAPNNLTVTSVGTVLATVVTFSGDVPLLCAVGGRECRFGWAVWEVNPATRAASEVFSEGGKVIGSATTALEVGHYLFIGTMADDRIGVYRRD